MAAPIRTVVLCCVRNEGPWLVEWVAHHRELGFDALWVCSNDLTDGSDALLDRLAALGELRHFRGTVPADVSPQQHGLDLMQGDAAYAGFDWALVVDADEFLVLPPGVALQDFLAARHDSSAIAINWQQFGCGGALRRRPGTVAERFRSCDPRVAPNFKCFSRPRDTRRLTIHFPKLRLLRRITHSNGAPLIDRRRPPIDRSAAQLNHYVTKSLAELCAKHRRGRGAVDRASGPAYALRSMRFMVEHARLGGTRDERIARYRDGTARRMAALLGDPQVAAAQAACDRWLDRQLAEPATAALLGQLVDGVFLGGHGQLEGLADDGLCGWLMLAGEQPATTALVLLDRQPLGEIPLVPLEGRLGFTIPLPDHLLDGRPHLLAVHALRDGAHVGRFVDAPVLRPLTRTAASGCAGCIDGLHDGRLGGWVRAPSGPGARCRVRIDDGPPQEVVADRPRADVERDPAANRLGFTLAIDPAAIDGRWHRVLVEVAGPVPATLANLTLFRGG